MPVAVPRRARPASAALAATLLAAAALLGACTAGGGSAATGPADATPGSVVHSVTAAPEPTGPVSTGPTTAAAAASCPFLGRQAAADQVGMRLDRITVLRSAGRAVGCRLYALQGSPLSQSEHLPGPHQPALEITSARYASAVAAHNALVRLAEAGRNAQQATLVGQAPGACFQTAFDPADHGQDWACGYTVDRTLVLVRTVVTSPALSAILVTRLVARGW